MSAFALYTVGTIALLGSVIYGPILLHIPQIWIGVGEFVLIALAIMSAETITRSFDVRKSRDA